MAKGEEGAVGDVRYRVRYVRHNGLRQWQSEISRDGESWVIVVTPSQNKAQQLDAAIRGAIYANSNSIRFAS